MASIREVAKLAQVAPSTVSRALNGSGYVAEETKKYGRQCLNWIMCLISGSGIFTGRRQGL